MTVPRLSKAAERRLADALADVVQLVDDDGLAPSAAIAKSARAHGVPPGHVDLMVYGYNTARSEAQRQLGADLNEKAAAFPLADAAEVRRLLGEDDPPPDRHKLSGVLSDEYAAPPRWLQRPAALPEPDAPLAPPLSQAEGAFDDHQMDLAYKRAFDLEKLASSERAGLARANDRLVDSLRELDSYFHTFGHRAFPAVRDDAVRLFGKSASALFDILLEGDPALANERVLRRDTLQLIDRTRPPFSLVTDCLQKAGACLEAQARLDAALDEAVKAAGLVAEKYMGGPPSVTRGVLTLPRETTTKEADLMSGLLGGYLGSQALPVEKPLAGAKEVADIKNELARGKLDPTGQDIRIRDMDTTSLLSDLMANDEVLAAYPPGDVLAHYNEISQLAPRAANNSALVRAVLRKRLEGGRHAVDPFEVDLLLRIENQLKNRDVLSPADKGVLG